MLAHGGRGLNQTILIDDNKAYLKAYKWRINGQGYVMGTINGRSAALHRHLMNHPMGYIDHRNGNKLDNRLENLRLSNHSQNMANSKVRDHSQTRVKGVFPFRDRFRVYVAGGYIGVFRDLEEAGHIYNQVALQIFGEFARLNDI
jgi:hypothetical protein